MRYDGHAIARLHFFVDEFGRRAPGPNQAIEERCAGRLVEEEDEVSVIADPLRLEWRVALRRGKQLSVREVVDRLDRLRNAIFGDQEIVSIQAEDLIAARIGHHGVDEDHIDIDLFTELRLLLREGAGGEEKTNCELFEHGYSLPGQTAGNSSQFRQ